MILSYFLYIIEMIRVSSYQHEYFLFLKKKKKKIRNKKSFINIIYIINIFISI